MAVVAGALAVLVLAATWYLFLKPTEHATGATIESPLAAETTQGVDYDFITKAADGSPARWDCTMTITVRRAGPDPAGADTAFAEAVDALRATSNLPLVVGAPLPPPSPRTTSPTTRSSTTT